MRTSQFCAESSRYPTAAAGKSIRGPHAAATFLQLAADCPRESRLSGFVIHAGVGESGAALVYRPAAFGASAGRWISDKTLWDCRFPADCGLKRRIGPIAPPPLSRTSTTQSHGCDSKFAPAPLLSRTSANRNKEEQDLMNKTN